MDQMNVRNTFFNRSYELQMNVIWTSLRYMNHFYKFNFGCVSTGKDSFNRYEQIRCYLHICSQLRKLSFVICVYYMDNKSYCDTRKILYFALCDFL